MLLTGSDSGLIPPRLSQINAVTVFAEAVLSFTSMSPPASIGLELKPTRIPSAL